MGDLEPRADDVSVAGLSSIVDDEVGVVHDLDVAVSPARALIVLSACAGSHTRELAVPDVRQATDYT
jgi:hypothetical protein